MFLPASRFTHKALLIGIIFIAGTHHNAHAAADIFPDVDDIDEAVRNFGKQIPTMGAFTTGYLSGTLLTEVLLNGLAGASSFDPYNGGWKRRDTGKVTKYHVLGAATAAVSGTAFAYAANGTKGLKTAAKGALCGALVNLATNTANDEQKLYLFLGGLSTVAITAAVARAHGGETAKKTFLSMAPIVTLAATVEYNSDSKNGFTWSLCGCPLW